MSRGVQYRESRLGTESCFSQTNASFRKDHDINLYDLTDGRASRARRIVFPILRWRESRVAIRMLEALNDRHRLDIGIQRSDTPILIAEGR